MDRISLRNAAVMALVGGFGLHAASASAQTGTMTRTWVSGTATTAGNACTQTSPCQTFAQALAQTAPGGEINCLTAGGFGPATITASVSIVCDNTEAGIIATSNTTPNGIVINGAGAIVTLSGLDVDGFGSGTNGIQFINGASLVLDNVKVRNFTGYGVQFAPSTAATLTIRKALLTGNGGTSTTVSGGLYIHPTAGIVIGATIGDLQLANNVNAGLRVDSASGATVNITIVDAIASNNGVGLLFRAPSGTVNASIIGGTLTNNAAYGLLTNGAPVMATVSDTTITANGIGIAPNGGSTISTFGDNRLFGNTTNGVFSASTITQ